jgi:hypothetical protein
MPCLSLYALLIKGFLCIHILAPYSFLTLERAARGSSGRGVQSNVGGGDEV